MKMAFVMMISIGLLEMTMINAKPVIGIFGLPNPQEETEEPIQSTVGRAYVTWLEASGADTVVIQPWFTNDELDDILGKVNGVLFQGGHVPLGTTSQYDKSTAYIVNKSKEFHAKGDHFPVWGTCLGFESILIVEAGNKEVLGYFSDSKRSHPSILTENTEISKLYSLFSEKDIDLLENEDSTLHYHIRGISEKAFNQYYLKDNYIITLLANDENDKTFISSFEGKTFPIYGVQFHPEKTPFNREIDFNLLHTPATIKVSQLLGLFLVNEARKNEHTFTYPTDKDNYDFLYTNRAGRESFYSNLNYYYQRKQSQQNHFLAYDNILLE